MKLHKKFIKSITCSTTLLIIYMMFKPFMVAINLLWNWILSLFENLSDENRAEGYKFIRVTQYKNRIVTLFSYNDCIVKHFLTSESLNLMWYSLVHYHLGQYYLLITCEYHIICNGSLDNSCILIYKKYKWFVTLHNITVNTSLDTLNNLWFVDVIYRSGVFIPHSQGLSFQTVGTCTRRWRGATLHQFPR